MITGTVNERREAIISIEVHGARGKRLVMDAVIDTGFDGFVILPPFSIAALGLRRLGSENAELGDGSIRKLAVYSAWRDVGRRDAIRQGQRGRDRASYRHGVACRL